MRIKDEKLSIALRIIGLVYIAATLFLFAFFGLDKATAFSDMKVFFFSVEPGIVHMIFSGVILISVIVLVALRRKVHIDVVTVCLFIKCILDIVTMDMSNQITSWAYMYFYHITVVSLAVYFMITNIPFLRKDRKLITTFFIVFGLVLCAQTFYTLYAVETGYGEVGFKAHMVIPWGGTNIIASALCPILCLTLLGVKDHIARWGISAVLFAAIFATKSKGGILLAGVCILACMLQAYCVRKKWWLRLLMILAAGGAAVAVVLLYFKASPIEGVENMSLFEILDRVTTGRMRLWRGGLEMLDSETILMGTGMYPPQHEISNAGLHNIVLDLLVRCGIVGTLNYAVAFVFICINGIKIYRKRRNPFFIAVMTVYINSLFEVCYFSYKSDVLLWIFVGLTTVYAQRCEQKGEGRVLQVNCVYGEGSTGKIVYDIHTALPKSGYDSAVCYGRGKRIRQSGVYKTCTELYSKFNNLISRFTGVMYGGLGMSTCELIEVIEDEQPDIVHLHCINGYFVNVYRIIDYLKKKGIATVVTLHAEFLYTANCGHALECEKWKSGCGNCPRRKQETRSLIFDNTRLSWKLLKRSYNGFDNMVVTSVSPWLMSRAKESPMLSQKEHRVILNGLDTETFRLSDTDGLREKHGLTDEKIILHVTPNFSLAPEHIKGGVHVVSLAEKLRNENVKILVAGGYDQGVSYPDNVILLGAIKDKSLLAAYYSLADVTLLTSKRETFSMVVAESVCCGTPVVGFKAGAPEQIAPEEYSEFVEQGNVEALAEATERMLGRELDKREISDCGKKIYSKETMAEAYIGVYRELLDKRK